MDLSNEYVEMCRQAKEIQVLWEPKDGDFFFTDHGVTASWGCSERRDCWVPRQDQLQEFAGLTKDGMLDSWITMSLFMSEVQCGILGSNFKSMEQLWFAFVMKENFGKVWNGSGWIKEISCQS